MIKGLHAVYQYNEFDKRITTQEYEGKSLVRDIDYLLDMTKGYLNLLQIEENGEPQSFVWDLDAAYVQQGLEVR